MAAKKPENMTFEATLDELESIVTTLEQGDLPLEDALRQFERGVGLSRAGQQKLQQAEQQVKVLLQEQGEEQLIDMSQDEQRS
ncbi:MULTISPECIES: exodeoxyribonuclease VII small subunit [Corallincola]|uniref:Exodeoxyribonuclease 7 small subunit n=3 Tax=Corallincola TaxID=1775176 RepID=A0A368N6T9_9GAMM|nr:MULTISPECIES: exodeoxyribonuclease VII small subunit [Corallincola]RCU45245.1 exodeoxyribonuclease VII small subunit [Corallincola holothuriorum]TAA43634.1 exodeoxyribonuclease VII small subunit [Corallincola spongiicola]TCI02886.1 exodeoxyribonuclease VII small subunit [Corallincola luteus]